MLIREGGLDHPGVRALLAYHYEQSRAASSAAKAHVFHIDRLAAPDIRFWSAWGSDDGLLGVAALKRLKPETGEVKSMHVAAAARRTGVGRRLMERIEAAARADGVRRLYLETGSFDYFAPARRLYESCGFVSCSAFDAYVEDPASCFMSKEVDRA
ncbi:MAG: GNAT family N-acetyltransferase [Alphaproteobacteria bacterium]|nr:GNAT family N-acetyltransferase [Alphaproteobacteria bacterium]